MFEEYLIGIDAGTSYVKAVLFDLGGNELMVSAVPTEVVSPMPSWVEIDMIQLWDKVKYCVAEIVSRLGTASERIKGIGITGPGDGTWMIDEQGNPVRHGIYWCDGRAGNIAKRWGESGISQQAYKICGTSVFAGSQSCQIAWLKENEPESLEKAKVIFHCKDWIFYKMTGRISTDESDESLPMLNIAARQYDKRLFELFGMEEYIDKFPKVYISEANYGTVLPEVAQDLGLRSDMTVASGPMDVAACAIGTGTLENGYACSILGTAAIHEISMDMPLINPEMIGMTLCHGSRRKWIRLIAAMSATPNQDWFLKELGKEYKIKAMEKGISVFDYIDQVIRKVPVGCDGVLYHPYIFPGGERAPFVKASACASFTGLQIHHSLDYLMRAVYEGVGYAMLDCYSNMPADVKEVSLSGGGAKSNIWCKIVSDILGKTVKIPSGSEFGAKGAALNVGIILGLYNSFEDAIARTVRYERAFEPDLDSTKKYAQYYLLYKKTYENLMDSWDLRAEILGRT